MPPPRGTPNMLEGPGDYDMTATIHSDTYPAIDPTKADLTGKAVFVTGGSRGLGRAMVLSFAQAGASYIAVGARSDLSQVAKDAEAAALSANRAPPKFLPINLDIADPKSVEDAAAAVEKAFGRCDIVVNNAGVIGDMVLIGDSDPDAWWRVLEVNLRGPYLISRAFLPLLLKTGDAYVVNISSVGAHLFLNAEYAGKGLVSFAIHPGNIPTDMVGGHEGVPDHLKQVFVDSAEISADTIVFLTSEKRPWIGGRYINATWDMPQLLAKKDEIVAGDKLKLRLDF